jgi:hypothetical protein
MAFFVNCAQRKKNTGLSSLCQDLSNTRKFILVPKGWSLTEAEARDMAEWTDGIHAEVGQRIYPFPVIHNFTDNSEDMVMDEGALGSIFVRDGKINFQFEIESSRYKHEAMKSHSLQKYDVVIVDANDRLHGVVASNGNFKGGNLQQFVVGKLMVNDGTGSATKSQITMIFGDTNEWETRPAVIAGLDWSPTNLEGLTDIYITDVAGTTSTTTLTATDKSGNAFNGELGDFVIKNASGVVQTISAVTASGGENVLTATLTSGVYTVDLAAPSAMVTKGFGSAEAVEFTVS